MTFDFSIAALLQVLVEGQALREVAAALFSRRFNVVFISSNLFYRGFSSFLIVNNFWGRDSDHS
jgi:hypothetical protein